MADIFISYARADRDRVTPLVELLEAQNWSVWWDTGMRSGERWDATIEREIHAARCIVVVWSKTSVGRAWVREEAHIGRERGILVPLSIDDATPPIGFKLIQTADLSEWNDNRAAKQALRVVGDVRAKLGGTSGPIPEKPISASTPQPVEPADQRRTSENSRPDDGLDKIVLSGSARSVRVPPPATKSTESGPPSDQARLVARGATPPGTLPRGFAAPHHATPPPANMPRSTGTVRPPGTPPGPNPVVSPNARTSVGPPQRPASAEPWISHLAARLSDAARDATGEDQRIAIFPIMESLVQRMLLEGVLDNAEMQQLFEWNHSTRRDVIGLLIEWAEQNFPSPSEANGLRLTVHRSTALQAWRERVARPEPLSPAERSLAAYGIRWRDTFDARQGPEWCRNMAADAFALLIERTTKGYPPVVAFDELTLLKPVLQASGHLPTLQASLAYAMYEPVEERNGMPPGSGAAFLRDLHQYLQGIQ